MRHPLLPALSLLLVPAVWGTAHTATASADVAVRTFQFTPDTLRVRVGTAVTWTNQDETTHTVTAGTPDARSTAFNHVLEAKGATATLTVTKPGTITYFCDRHQFMRGALTVTP